MLHAFRTKFRRPLANRFARWFVLLGVVWSQPGTFVFGQQQGLETRVYQLQQLQAEAARTQLLTALGDLAEQVKVNADRYANQLVIVAPAAVHNFATQLIAQLDAPPAAKTKVSTQKKSSDSRNPAKINLQLQTLSADQLHTRMQKVLRRSLATSQDPSGTWLGFNIHQQQSQPVTVWANQQNSTVQLSGPEPLVQAWQKVILTLDTPAGGLNATQLIATKPGSKLKVRETVQAIQTAAIEKADGFVQQANPPATGEQLPDRNDAAVGGDATISLLGPVQIETIEGTDILLLRGNPRDVERVMEVIEDIERMSAVGEPEIDIVELQHVEAEALAALLNKIFAESLNSQKYGYGSVGVYPLARPNSILLIALPATMDRAKETIAKLDRPGKEATQFESFALKHARAADARTIVENLFSAQATDEAGATTLAPKAQVIADSRTNSLIVRASPRDLAEVRELVNQIDQVGSQSMNELRIFKLKSSVAEDLEDVLQDAFTGDPDDDSQNKLSQLLQLVTIDEAGKEQLESGVLASARVTASASANALIVTAPAKSMSLMETLIAQLDQAPDAAIELKIFPLENGDAAALVDTLSELFSTGEGGNNDGNEITRLRVEVDERTNSILAAGTLEDLITVEAILRTLDSAEGRDRQNRVYRLRHKRAEDLADALNSLLQAERDVQSTAPGTVSPFEQLEREVLVVPEISGNSLLVSATPNYFEKMDRLISELDVRDDMVMIQVLIAEIELGDTDEFGVELGLQDSVLFDRSLLENIDRSTNITTVNNGGNSTVFENQVIDTATLTPGFNFGNPAQGLPNAGSTTSLATAADVAGQALSSFGVNRVSPEAGFGGLVLSASSNSVSMLLRALQESRRLEVLSRPQIMALNNQEGSTFVGQLVPFIVRSDLNQLGLTTNTVEQIEVGLSLVVYPRISPDGLVVLDITATNNRLRPLNEGVPVAVSPNGDPILQPIQDAIQARTVVSAMSGQTVVLSGLITKEDNELHRRVPILADIPLLGDLFRFDSVSTTRRELLIVMTPHVVKNRFESEMLKQVESARMNWCLSDVVNLHGPAGLRSQTDRAGVAESETVFPEQLPAGTSIIPEAVIPNIPEPEIVSPRVVTPEPQQIPVPQ